MKGSPPHRIRAPGTLGFALALLGVLIVLLAVVEAGVPLARGADPLWVVLPLPLAALVFLIAGLIAWSRRPSNRSGALMVFGSGVLLITDLELLQVTWLSAVSVMLGTLMLAVLVHLLLAFPSGRLRSASSRACVVAVYGVSLALQAPLYLFDQGASPDGVLAIGDYPTPATIGRWVQRGCGIGVMIVAAVILAQRFRHAGPRAQRVLGPLYIYGVAAVLAVPVIPTVVRPLTGMPAEMTMLLQVGVISLVPVAIGCAMLLGGFARTGEVQELGAWLGAGESRPALRDAIAGTVGDPSVRLAFWAAGRYVDASGQPIPVAGGSARGVVEISLERRPVAAIEYDASLIADRELVAAAGRVVALALDRERLTAELRASGRDLQRSRARIVQAADRERRRIAQDLHDGLQAELVLLGVQAQDMADIAGATVQVAGAATDLRRQIDRVAGDLRQLVHSVMPPPLTQGGLISAVEDLVDRMPLPALLEVGGLGSDDLSSLPDEVQSTAYFVVAEGLANAVKHAAASRVGVVVSRSGESLTVEVRDDGSGGAHIGSPAAGRGLRGLTDRLQALGGSLTIDSHDGGGTRLLARVPCGC